MRWSGKKIGVLYGGVSRERDVSLRTGKAIAKALLSKGLHVDEIDVTLQLADQLKSHNIDVAFIALHGAYGEDGTIQGLLEYMRIPYTGTGVLGSAVAMNKIVCKHVAEALNIPVAHHRLFNANVDSIEDCVNNLSLELPVVVKPVSEGSTIGMTIVRDLNELPSALQLAATSDSKVMIEEYVGGTEVTVSVLCGRTLPIIEIVPKSGFYNYEAKYTKGMTEYILPARINETIAALLNDWTLRLCRELDVRGTARADYIVRRDGTAILLELNTIPGMTETSLVPQAAAKEGISFEDVCLRMLNDAKLHGGTLCNE